MPDYTAFKPKFSLTVGADPEEVSHTGATLTKKKEASILKGAFNLQKIIIEIELRTDNATNPAICRMRHDGQGSDDLVLQTSSTSYVTLSGVIDVSAFSAGRHIIEFHLEDGATETVFLRETWMYGAL